MLYVLQLVAEVVAFLGWFYALFTGKLSKGMRDLLVYCLPLSGADACVPAPADRAVPELLGRLRARCGGCVDGDQRRLPSRRRRAVPHRHRRRRAARGRHDPRAAPRRAGAPRPRPPAARLRAARPRRHVRLFRLPANDDGADLGVVFFHNAGYSTACGHGTIALVTWALDEGVVEPRRGREPGRRGRAVGPPRRPWARVEGRPGALGALPQRARRSSGRTGSRPPAARSTSPSAARSTLARGAGRRRRAAAADRARPRDQGATSRRSTRSSIRSSRSCATSTASSSGRRRARRRSRSATSPSSPTARSTARRAAAARPPGSRSSTRGAARRAAPSCGIWHRRHRVHRPRRRGDDVAGSRRHHRGRRQRLPAPGRHEFVLEPDDQLGEGFLLR